MKFEVIGEKNQAIFLYKNAMPNSLELIDRFEELVGRCEHPTFKWHLAHVGDNQRYNDSRNCLDCKLDLPQISDATGIWQDVKNVYREVRANTLECLRHYQEFWNIRMDYMEAINFVKYYEGQYFVAHTDHGLTYDCTVSSVGYLNDDYTGGELKFNFLDLVVKPEKGDIVLFPSTFLYAHESIPVKTGVKYSTVTMFDYSKRTHHLPFNSMGQDEIDKILGHPKSLWDIKV